MFRDWDPGDGRTHHGEESLEVDGRQGRTGGSHPVVPECGKWAGGSIAARSTKSRTNEANVRDRGDDDDGDDDAGPSGKIPETIGSAGLQSVSSRPAKGGLEVGSERMVDGVDEQVVRGSAGWDTSGLMTMPAKDVRRCKAGTFQWHSRHSCIQRIQFTYNSILSSSPRDSTLVSSFLG